MIRTTATLLLMVFALAPAHGGDWKQFRGPNGSGFSDEKNVPVQLGGDKLRWKVDLPGRGLSCPVIAGERVYLTACSGFKQRRLHVLCFDVKNGKKLWERQFDATGSTACHPATCMAAPTPVTDGKRVFALFGTGDLAALDREGNLLWYRSMVGDYPKITNQVGMAASPFLWNDVLLLPMENADQSFAAGVDAATGKNLWKVDRFKRINWITPTILQQGERAEAVFQTEDDVTAYDPKTGKVLWTFKDEETKRSTVTCPLTANGTVFAAGGRYVAFAPHSAEGKPKVKWTSNKLGTKYTSPLYHDGKIYGLTGVALNCVDAASGDTLSQTRLKGKFWASPILVNDVLYAVDENGSVSVVQVGKNPKVVAKHELNDKIQATPSIADGAIFFRSDKQMWCFSEK